MNSTEVLSHQFMRQKKSGLNRDFQHSVWVLITCLLFKTLSLSSTLGPAGANGIFPVGTGRVRLEP